MKSLVLLVLLLSANAWAPVSANAWSQHAYSTNFPATENPISEGGRWINGQASGIAWSNVQTNPGLAFGTQSGDAPGNATYADSTAILNGTWGADQEASATVHVTNAPNSSSVFEEVEIRLRTSITANSITGYEINCSVSTNSGNYYIQIVRWNGALASWTQLNGAKDHCVDGDTLKATIKGSEISVYHNGNLVETATDSTFSSGSPGIGFFLQGTTGTNSTFGFTTFSADDGSTTSPAPPTNLSATAH
jgi:hypothetical protein